MRNLTHSNPQTKEQIGFAPQVTLVNAFIRPYDNSVATARTCYSPTAVFPEEVSKDEKSRQKRDAIAQSIYLAGHHTTLQHATFQFVIEKVSRHCIWSFLHSHPFYNSEQVSQRYVAVDPSNFSVPALKDSSLKIYLEAIHFLMQAYQKLQEMLAPEIEKELKRIFPFRNLQEKKWKRQIQKKAQEVARYVLPIATHAHLYHTISGITLLRYWRICQIFDAPDEQKILVQKMVEEVKKIDAEFFKNAEEPLELEQTPEFLFFQSSSHLLTQSSSHTHDFVKEFDHSLGEFTSVLVDYKINCEKVMADAVRNLLGFTKSELEDSSAIELALNPQKNSYLSETLNLSHHSKLMRAMVHPHFTFRKKISHTADSQDQRHRTVPGSRPILSRHFNHRPDYVTPALIASVPPANAYYKEVLTELWKKIELLLNDGTKLDAVLYLLPNAFPIRFEESGSLLDFHHKWVHRLCYTAQEEIWKNCLDEVSQVEKLFPLLSKYLRPPCFLRQTAERVPFCPEGERFCGVPVWKLPLSEYQRII